MKDLKAGLRHISLMQMLVTLTALLACVALILFGLDARSTAKQSQRVAQHAINTERAILEVIVTACESRVVYDSQSLGLATRVNGFAAALDAVVSENVILPGADPKVLKAYNDEVKAIKDLRSGTNVLAARKVINNCHRYQAVLDTLPAGTGFGNGGAQASPVPE